jgi:hypothetical protein
MRLPSEVDPLAMGGNPEHVGDAGLVERFGAHRRALGLVVATTVDFLDNCPK